jgi:hypothetical protein
MDHPPLAPGLSGPESSFEGVGVEPDTQTRRAAPLVAGAHASEARALLAMVTLLDGTSRSGSLQRHPFFNSQTLTCKRHMAFLVCKFGLFLHRFLYSLKIESFYIN